jgi:epsin
MVLMNFFVVTTFRLTLSHAVRNRAKEIVELLGDVERIRTERRKAKANKTKYTGVGSDGMAFSSGSGGRYGGFGSESMSGGGGGGSGGDYPREGSRYGGGGGGSSRGGGSSSYDQGECLILYTYLLDIHAEG